MKPSKETIFALATQRGKSGIAVFRVSGKGSHTIIKSISSKKKFKTNFATCLLYTSPSPRDVEESRMPSSA